MIELNEKMKTNLETLAGVYEEDYTKTDRGIKFSFKNSLQANFCHIVEYHDKYIVEFRKIADNPIEGSYNILVSEDIIEPENLQEHFENVTGIYLSYLDK